MDKGTIKIESDDNISSETVDEDILNSDTRNAEFQCEYCSESFYAEALYEFHQNIHDPAKYCPHCNRTYKIVKHFQEHIQNHLKTYIQCEYCPKILFGRRVYISHISQHRKQQKLYKCTFCEKSFSTKKQKTTHERVHTNERPYKCEKCNKTFKQNGSLKTHMNTHQEEKTNTCEVCQGKFATGSSLKRHLKRVHLKGRSMRCKLCGDVFFNQDSFFTHRMEKHPNIGGFFRACPICPVEFTCKSKYRGHIRIHETNGELEYSKLAEPSNKDVDVKDAKKQKKCFLCGTVIDLQLYAKHENEHLGISKEEELEYEKAALFPCKQCNNVLFSKRSAMNHVDVHLDKGYFCSKEGCNKQSSMTYMSYSSHDYDIHREIKCKNCKETFEGLNNFKKHRKCFYCTPKFQKKTLTYICKWCKCPFATSYDLLVHYKSHKGANAYKCDICNRKYPLLVKLKKHLSVVHSQQLNNTELSRYKIGVKKFFCTDCKLLFESKKSFDLHEYVHFSSKFQCKTCNARFVKAANYLYHINNHLCSTWLAEALLGGVQDSKCVLCNKVLRTFRAYAYHMVNVHSQNNFQCRYCELNCNSLYKMRYHLIKRHRHEKKYVCTLCKASFKLFKEYICHQRIHKKNKDITCQANSNNIPHKETVVKQEQPDMVEYDDDFMDIPENVRINQNGELEDC